MEDDIFGVLVNRQIDRDMAYKHVRTNDEFIKVRRKRGETRESTSQARSYLFLPLTTAVVRFG